MSEAQTEIELDLDDAQEQSVEVDVKQEPVESVQDAVGEVDLGYVDPVEKTEEKVVMPEPTDTLPKDNLQDVSEKTQKRIDKLTRKMREAERREKAALDYAKGLQTKYDSAKQTSITSDESYVKEFDARVDAQREQVRIKMQDAIEENDSAKIVEANDELTRLAVEKEKARMRISDLETSKEARKVEQAQTQVSVEEKMQSPQNQQEPSRKATEWAEKNEWFGSDEVMTNAAFSIHENLVKEGFDAESDDYYNEVNDRLKGYFPHKFASTKNVEKSKPVQTVASAGRKQQGRRKVNLTRSQVAIAKKLGVPLEEYAKYVKE